MSLPSHVAIIMDGNGRWGIKKKNSRKFGHKKGLKTVEKIINVAIKKKIKFLTLFVFSTENWKRPSSEINYLFKILSIYRVTFPSLMSFFLLFRCAFSTWSLFWPVYTTP